MGDDASKDEKATLPRATLSRLISASLPSNYTCSDAAKDVIHDCCKEFVQLLASEANEMTNGAEGGSGAGGGGGRGRISAAHLLAALNGLGYERYVREANEIAEGEKADAKFAPRKAGKRKLEQSGKSMTELKAQQAALFERSRARLQQQISSGALQPTTTTQATITTAAATPSPSAL